MLENPLHNFCINTTKDWERKVHSLVSILLILLFGASCCKITDPIDNDDSNDHFGIFFLADTTLKIWEIHDQDISSLILQDEPWICHENIRFYDWSTHYIYLTGSWKDFIPLNQNTGWFADHMRDRPFVVATGDESVYIGFICDLGSSGAENPGIYELGLRSGHTDILPIWWPFIIEVNPCDDEKLRQALRDDDLYHGGIEFDIDLNTLIFIEDSDTCNMQYTYSLTNMDEDNLFVLDAEESGEDVFNFFNDGPFLFNTDTEQPYYAVEEGICPSPGDWSLEGWYTLLQTGQSIVRTTTVRLNQHPPPGEYLFVGHYISPSSNELIAIRETAEGRTWMGKTRTPIYTFNLTNGTISKE